MKYAERRPEEAEAEALQLRQEVEDLKRQLQVHQGKSSATGGSVWHPSRAVIWGIFLCATVLVVAAFFAGYIPLRARNILIRGEASEQATALPRVDVITVGRASTMSELDLPGNIQAV